VEVLNALRSWEDKAKILIEKYEIILKPIMDLCRDYNIPLNDVAATLEEYIVRDNE
jgi:CO dehydrogenase/acetyl-CoA synthase alpha subunit